MFTRANNRDPLYHETLHICLGELIEKIVENNIKDVHFPITDPEGPNNNLFTWYTLLMDNFADESIDIYLHDRVHVSVAAISQFPFALPVDEFDHERSGTLRDVPNPR